MQALVDKTDLAAGKPMKVTVLRGAERIPGNWASTDAGTTPVAIPGLVGARQVTADAAPLRKGDVIAMPSAAGPITPADDTPGADSPVLLRGLTVVELNVMPVRTGADKKGRMGIEISPALVPARIGWLAAPAYGVRTTANTIVAMVHGLALMFTGRMAVNVAGPVRIAEISKDAGQRGASLLLTFMAILSINLGVINLLPIPALDGGRLFFIAVEALRGRRIEPNREAMVNMIGFALVLGLMLVVTVMEVLGLGGAR
jgi:regulator of sigma E protease